MSDIGIAGPLWRYPVTSLGGESLDSLQIGAQGVLGDRTHGLLDPASRGTAQPGMNARWNGITGLFARTGAEGPELQVGDTWVPVTSPEAEAAIEAAFGFPMLVRPHGETGAPRRYEPHGLHLLTTGALQWLARAVGPIEANARRFRPNLVVDAPGDLPENDWVGRRIAIGEVRFEVYQPARRCGFTIMAHRGLSECPEVLRHLRRHNGINFGVYARPLSTGRIARGDPVRLLD